MRKWCYRNRNIHKWNRNGIGLYIVQSQQWQTRDTQLSIFILLELFLEQANNSAGNIVGNEKRHVIPVLELTDTVCGDLLEPNGKIMCKVWQQLAAGIKSCRNCSMGHYLILNCWHVVATGVIASHLLSLILRWHPVHCSTGTALAEENGGVKSRKWMELLRFITHEPKIRQNVEIGKHYKNNDHYYSSN